MEGVDGLEVSGGPFALLMRPNIFFVCLRGEEEEVLRGRVDGIDYAAGQRLAKRADRESGQRKRGKETMERTEC